MKATRPVRQRTKKKLGPSNTDDWCTPRWLTELLGGFDLDPCSNEHSHVLAAECCRRGHFLGSHCDGLKLEWPRRRSVYCNPPYSNVGPWASKLVAHDGPWVALVKLDPSTKWWSTLMAAHPTIAPFNHRLKFEGPNATTANFPSVLVYSAWRPSAELREHLWLQAYR